MITTSSNGRREQAANMARHLRAHNIKPRSSDQTSSASPLREGFRKFATWSAGAVGSPWAFVVATLSIVIWAGFGPAFKYSNTWQLVINTGTTIITFLMVFLIQNTQNRDARAIHLKLDELIRASKGSRDALVDLENCSDEELADLEEEFRRFREERKHAGKSRSDDE